MIVSMKPLVLCTATQCRVVLWLGINVAEENTATSIKAAEQMETEDSSEMLVSAKLWGVTNQKTII